MNRVKTPAWPPLILLGILLLVGWLPILALGQKDGHVTDLRFTKEDQLTRLNVLFEGPLEYTVVPNLKEKWIELRLLHTAINDEFLNLAYSDDRIEGIQVTQKPENEVDVRIQLKNVNTTFFHQRTENPPSVALDIRSRKGMIQMKFGKEGAEAPPPPAPEGELVVAGFTAEEPLPPPEAEIMPAGKPAPVAFAPLLSPEEETQLKAKYSKAGRKEYETALKMYHDKKYLESAKLLSDFIQFNKESPLVERAFFLLGDAMFEHAKQEKTNYREALDVYRVALSKFPLSKYREKATLRMGDLYKFQKLFLEAKAEYSTFLRKYPNSPFVAQVLTSRAEIFIAERKFQLAYNDLEKVLLIYPFSLSARDAQFQIGSAFFESGDFKTAAEIYDDTVKRFPTYPRRFPEILYRIAESFYQVKRYGDAMKDFLDLVNLFPTSDLAGKSMYRIGDSFVGQGNLKDGIRIYDAVVQRYKGKPEAVTAKLRLENLRQTNPELLPDQPAFKIDMSKDSLRAYDEIISRTKEGPDQMEAFYQKALVYSQRKQYGEAILTLKLLLQKYPKGSLNQQAFQEIQDLLLTLIQQFYDQEGFFVVLLTYVDHFDPFLKGINRPDILVKIADSFRRMGLLDRALQTYDRVEAMDPKGKWKDHVAFNRARIYLLKEQYEETEKSARFFLSRYPESPWIPDAEFLLAESYYLENRFNEAIAQFHIAIETVQKNPPQRQLGILPSVLIRYPYDLYLLGNAYKEVKRHNLAVYYHRMAIQSFEDMQRAEMDYRGITLPEPYYVAQSYYLIVDSLYLMEQYRQAIEAAEEAIDRYPDHENNSWARYIISGSYKAINLDEDSTEQLKELLDKDKTSIVGKVAQGTVNNDEWEKKNSSLFAF